MLEVYDHVIVTCAMYDKKHQIIRASFVVYSMMLYLYQMLKNVSVINTLFCPQNNISSCVQ